MHTPVASALGEGFVGPAWSGMRSLVRNPGVEITVAMATIAIARMEIMTPPPEKTNRVPASRGGDPGSFTTCGLDPGEVPGAEAPGSHRTEA